MIALIGLGNPDRQYQNTRHNLGQLVILNLIQNLNLKLKTNPKLSAKIIKHQDWLIAIPTTFMNESGLAVQKILSYYKISPNHLYVIHDDLDLGVGDWKIQFDRGPAGHNGVTSVIQNLGTQSFYRLRVGIDHPSSNIPIEDYVLKPFLTSEKQIITATLDKILPDLQFLIKN
ncbi:aminoacyl-tRNA hydrolase [Patescibacteria group bacterium]|nr:aminoacyl-tRNA hydrolase [Patescibacteria group bacterium]